MGIMNEFIVEASRLTTAKNEKVDSLHATAIKFIGQKQLVYLFPIILLNFNFCEYVKFGAILWKIDILSITAQLKFKSKNPLAHM